MRTSRLAESIVDRIENAQGLDGLAATLNSSIGKLIPSGPVEDVLSGTPIGHPAHPALVALPIGAWSSAIAMDLAGEDDAARRLIGLGVVTAVPAAATGASDWLTVDGAERRVGLVHALLNYGAISLYGLSWLARGRGRRGLGIGLSAAGTAVVSAAGWLGGHMSYAQGVGVDTTVFETLPEEWTHLCAVDDLPTEGTLGRQNVDGVPILVTRRGDDVVALTDRCTHRGAPLDEGEIKDGCVVCPWHASVFSLDDGEVRSGPATRPQTRLESRIDNGRVQVRRRAPRTLPARSAGA
ncbi:Rieske 2Fe-2S domain-containing protein [uncultured Jatrophihabitans sp.]|uniref:Rieske 2Fe-2S domain-containing protein n=1 Tax=uncultured Jatrophihabitans sp. TaxID=1610747 RepID=UPI0035CAF42B